MFAKGNVRHVGIELDVQHQQPCSFCQPHTCVTDQRHQPPDVVQFNALLLDTHKVVIGNWRTNERLIIIRNEDVGEDVGTGEAVLSDGKVGDGFDCTEHTAH